MNIKSLIEWSQNHFHELPWRQNRSLYRTLVSEIMLQQTTVGTVKNHYQRFLATFPDIQSLARASEEELIIAWKGLGYYRRARNLKKIAEAIVSQHGGKFPQDVESLKAIPGIGLYTSHALIAIGMDGRGLAVDANLERVIARLLGLKEMKGVKLQKAIHQLFAAGELFNDNKLSYRGLNEALMDLGRTYCQARKASCELCPLSSGCVAFSQKNPLAYPTAEAGAKKKTQEHELHLLRIYCVKKGKLLVYQKEEKEWLAGQFEVPTLLMKSSDKKLAQYPVLRGKDPKAEASFKSGITKYKIINSLVRGDEKTTRSLGFGRPLVWKDIAATKSNLTTTTTKGLIKLGYL